jgi:hypothetical protein
MGRSCTWLERRHAPSGAEPLAHRGIGVHAHGGCRGTESCRQIHPIAKHGVVQSLPAAHAARHHVAVGQTHADLDGVLRAMIDARARHHHVHGAACRAHRVVGAGLRGAEDRHDQVAHELVDHAAVAIDHLGQRGHVLVQKVHHLMRAQPVRERREAADVAEDHGRGRGHAAQIHGAADHLLGDARIGHQVQQAAVLVAQRQSVRHVVEARRELTDLVAPPHRHAHREIARPHATRRLGELGDRLRDATREHERHDHAQDHADRTRRERRQHESTQRGTHRLQAGRDHQLRRGIHRIKRHPVGDPGNAGVVELHLARIL